MNVAIILAGGTGSRIGAGIPKQFIEVQGKPILAYTLEAFQRNANTDAIELVCHPDWTEKIRQIVSQYGIAKCRWYCAGGETFQQSVQNGIYNLKDMVAADDIAVISFGVSPFLTDEIINDSIRVARLHGNGIASVDMVLCTCIKDDEKSSTQNIIRETLKGFDSPWSFRYGELLEVYETAAARGILGDIEPHTTSVYFALGKRIWFSKSNRRNFKITTRDDLDMFEGLLLLEQQRSKGECK